MTDRELGAILARADRATPGPWDVEYDESDDGEGDEDCPWRIQGVCSFVEEARSGKAGRLQSECDADFVAHARTDVPALIAEIMRLRRAVRGAQ